MFLKELHSILPIFAEAPRGIQRMRASIKGSETRVVLWVGVVIWRCRSTLNLYWGESRNAAHDLEALPIFSICTHLCQGANDYTWRMPSLVMVFIKHQNLKYFQLPKVLNRHKAHWYMQVLSLVDFVIQIWLGHLYYNVLIQHQKIR